MVVESLAAIGLSLFVLVAVFNVGFWAITSQIAHSAVDQAVRAGAREDVDPVAACTDRLAQTLGNLARGSATYGCDADAETVTARVRLPLRAWLPLVGRDRSTAVAAVARREGIRP